MATSAGLRRANANVGTRLHAGIRALQKSRRSIIVEIDNRAREMGAIDDHLDLDIRLPQAEIDRWKGQFHAR